MKEWLTADKLASANRQGVLGVPLDDEDQDLVSSDMARQRHIAMKNLRHLDDEVYLSHDEPFIDFSSAGLYLVGLQTTVATVACSAASVACCWLLPSSAVSAVRTLAITSGVGFLCMRKPVRIGRVRGVNTLFNALRPCIAMYISVLTIEQLVHTCVATDNQPPGYTRRVVFHFMVGLMAMAGFVRAYRPSKETDAPFLITAFALLVIAMLPPPATPLTGPLCQAASFFSAGERLLRAFLFAALYVIHVYCSPPNRNAIHDLAVCIMRCAAASVWVLGCHFFVLWIGILQAFVALWARFGHDNSTSNPTYNTIDTRSDSGLSDAELGIPPPPVLSNSVAYYTDYKEVDRSPTPEAPSSYSSGSGSSEGVPVDAASLAAVAAQVHGGGGGGGMSKDRMAAIAASIA